MTQEDMYGRANPKPTPPSFDADDVRKMRAAEEARLLAARADDGDVAWLEIDVPRELGLELDRYKWRQNQSFVEVFVRLPRGCAKKDVRVEISATTLDVRVREERVINGALRATVKAELSTWVIVDDVLEIALLKKNRRGHYDNGCTNADTFWYSVCLSTKFGGQNQPGTTGDHRGARRLALTEPPHEYYDTDWIADPEDAGPAGRDKNGRGASSRGRAIKGRR